MVHVKSTVNDVSHHCHIFDDIQAFHPALSVLLAGRQSSVLIRHGRFAECHEQYHQQFLAHQKNENTQLFFLYLIRHTVSYHHAFITDTLFCRIFYHRRTAKPLYAFNFLPDHTCLYIHDRLRYVPLCIRNFSA